MKSGYLKVCAALVLVLAGIVLSVTLYFQSEHFKTSIGNALSTMFGGAIELGQGLQIESLYPRIDIKLPNAKLRASDMSDRIRRARLQNLLVSINYDALTSGGTKGDIVVSVDNLTIISQSGQATALPDNSDSNATGKHEDTGSVYDQLSAIRSRMSGLDISIEISRLDFFARNPQSGNTVHRFSKLSIASELGNVIAVRADVQEGEYAGQQLSMDIQNTADNVEPRFSGNFSIVLASAANPVQSHQLQAVWSVEGNDVNLANVQYQSDVASLLGEVAMSFSDQQVRINSELDLRRWDISTVGKTSVQTPRPERLFPYDPFMFNVPGNIRANIALHLGAVRLDGLPIVNGPLVLNLNEGILDVSSEDLTLLGGPTQFTLQLDNSTPHFIGFNLKLETDNLQLNRIRRSDSNDTILSRGDADIIVALRGSGPSPGHITSSLDGYVIASIKAAQVKKKYSTLIDVGVVNWAIDRLSLLTKDGYAKRNSAILSDPLTIECASLRMYINDGRVEVSNGAILEMTDNILFSSGYIDLESETMGFAFRTRGRSVFDWSAVSIAKFAEIGGSLASPDINLNAAELAKQGVMVASTAAWGPLPSLVYSLAESGVKNMKSDQCTPDID